MKNNDYLKRQDRVQIVSNHSEHPGRKGAVLSISDKSPQRTSEFFDYVAVRLSGSSEWIEVRLDHLVKLDSHGKPIPYVDLEEKKQKKKKKKRKARRKKESYPDREVDWGQWIRYDLHDGSTLVRPHVGITDRYANTDLEVELRYQKKLKKRWKKYTGWVVRPKYGDKDSWIFVKSLDEAESYPFPPLQFEAEEGSDEEIAFEPQF